MEELQLFFFFSYFSCCSKSKGSPQTKLPFLLNLTTSDSTKFITQLLKNNSLVHTFSSSQFNLKEKTQFLNPGSYNLRVIKDSDGNGKWSSGNFNIKRQPESIAYYNKPIEIKAGWDIEVIWDFK